jgi:hypothetical protein
VSAPYYSDEALAKQAEMDRKRAAGEPITTDDMLGILQPRDPRIHRYGQCPQQVEGIAKNGRPFYFRERGGEWTLDVGPVDAEPGYLMWCDSEESVAYGDWEPDCDEIDQLITQHLGAGWVQVNQR